MPFSWRRGTRCAVANRARNVPIRKRKPEKPDSKPSTSRSIEISCLPMTTDWPKSLAPASAPLTTSRFTARANTMMKSEESVKYAMQRPARGRLPEDLLDAREERPHDAFSSARIRSTKTSSRLERTGRELGEQRSPAAQAIDQDVQLLDVARRHVEVSVDARDRRAGLAQSLEQSLVDTGSDELVATAPPDLRGQIFDRALGRDRPSPQHGHAAADLLDLREQMRVQQDRPALARLLLEEVADLAAADRVDAVGRLVQTAGCPARARARRRGRGAASCPSRTS